MKVAYDISVLGLGFFNSRARTGVFRVVECLAMELVKKEAISHFSSAKGIVNYLQCQDYLVSNKSIESVSMIEPNINQSIVKLYKILHSISDKTEKPFWYIKGMNRVATKIDSLCFSESGLSSFELDNCDVFHSPFYPIPQRIKKHKNIKKVLTIHDLIPVLYPGFFQFQENHLITDIIKSIDETTWVTCVSSATKDDLCNYLPTLDPDRVFVTHLAASKLFYAEKDIININKIRNKFEIPEGEYVLSLSTLEPRKNIAQTIKCFSRIVLEQSIPDLSLVLVGAKGWDYDSIFDEIAATPNIKKKIIITGYVPDEYLAPLYSGALMFVYPSYYEGFGLPPLEAMQCGVPVITSNTSSLPEVVGDAGIMVEPDDESGLSQAILDVYSSPSIRDEMKKKSLLQSKKFSWERCSEKTIDVYKKAIS